MDAVKILLLRNHLWKVSAENLKTPNFYNGTQSARNDEKQDLFVA
jgi:hypothetical protein